MAQISAASEPVRRHDPLHRESLIDRFQAVRADTESLTANLAPEDQVIQSMEDASPSKWHLAHTSWFFETFILAEFAAGYRPFSDDFAFLFNSYYETAGPRHARPRRGMVTRPSVNEVMAYRAHVTAATAGCVPCGTRHQSRTAASGAAVDRYPARLLLQSDPPRLRPLSAGGSWCLRPPVLGLLRRRHPGDRP